MVHVFLRLIFTYRGVHDRALRPALMVRTPPQGSTGLQKERSSSSLLLMEARISSNNVLDLKQRSRKADRGGLFSLVYRWIWTVTL